MGSVIVVQPYEIGIEKQNRVIFKQIDTPTIEYEVLRELVGGGLEHYQLANELDVNGIDCWIDDEGKLKGLIPTFNLLNRDGTKLLDRIAGPVVFTGYNYSDTVPLSKEQEEIVIKWLRELDTSLCATRDMKHMYRVYDVPGFVSFDERYGLDR